MANVIIKQNLSVEDKLTMMREDSAFDIADDDSACIPDLSFIKDEIKSKPSPPKVPKMFLSNDCVFNCAYCGCRIGNDVRHRYINEPRELAEISVSEANKNGHGVFISSAI